MGWGHKPGPSIMVGPRPSRGDGGTGPGWGWGVSGRTETHPPALPRSRRGHSLPCQCSPKHRVSPQNAAFSEGTLQPQGREKGGGCLPAAPGPAPPVDSRPEAPVSFVPPVLPVPRPPHLPVEGLRRPHAHGASSAAPRRSGRGEPPPRSGRHHPRRPRRPRRGPTPPTTTTTAPGSGADPGPARLSSAAARPPPPPPTPPSLTEPARRRWGAGPRERPTPAPNPRARPAPAAAAEGAAPAGAVRGRRAVGGGRTRDDTTRPTGTPGGEVGVGTHGDSVDSGGPIGTPVYGGPTGRPSSEEPTGTAWMWGDPRGDPSVADPRGQHGCGGTYSISDPWGCPGVEGPTDTASVLGTHRYSLDKGGPAYGVTCRPRYGEPIDTARVWGGPAQPGIGDQHMAGVYWDPPVTAQLWGDPQTQTGYRGPTCLPRYGGAALATAGIWGAQGFGGDVGAHPLDTPLRGAPQGAPQTLTTP